MKNIFLILILFLSSQTVFGQWEKQFYVDENGVPTKDSYESLSARGASQTLKQKIKKPRIYLLKMRRQ